MIRTHTQAVTPVFIKHSSIKWEYKFPIETLLKPPNILFHYYIFYYFCMILKERVLLPALVKTSRLSPFTFTFLIWVKFRLPRCHFTEDFSNMSLIKTPANHRPSGESDTKPQPSSLAWLHYVLSFLPYTYFLHWYWLKLILPFNMTWIIQMSMYEININITLDSCHF